VEAYEFLVNAIESVPGERWNASSEPLALLIEAIKARHCSQRKRNRRRSG